MKYVGERNIKKFCNFYVSDLHLSVMLLPYISKQIDEDVEITTIFEKLEKEDVKKLLEKLNVKNKNEILNINWFSNKQDTDDKIKRTVDKALEDNKKATIIIGGNEKYVLDNNYKISKYIEGKDVNNIIKIINCFNVEEVGSYMDSIVKNYDGLLNTSGETNFEMKC